MTTANRLKKKRQNQQTQYQTPSHLNKLYSTGSINSPLKPIQQVKKSKTQNSKAHTDKQQQVYEQYYEISQSNPLGVTVTSTLFPHTAQMNAKYNVPLGFCLSPLLALQNQHAIVMEKAADRIPRCQTCRAYMNCYNTIEKRKFTCFLCNRQSTLDKDYDPNQSPNQQLNSSIYQAIGPTNFYAKQPAEQIYVFLLDITPETATSRVLYYAIAAMKEALSRVQLDEICIYLFTYDGCLHQYDFSGEEPICTILDPSIESKLSCSQPLFLKDIREKLFVLLDQLQQICQNNRRIGYSFSTCFSKVFSMLSYKGSKFFVIQSNEGFINEQIFNQNLPLIKQGQNNQGQKTLSLFQTKNKQFFNKYTEQILKSQSSISFFIFSKNSYKNLRSIHDCLKLSSSELKYYNKQSAVDLQKFYYQFTYLLGASYCKNVRVQFILSAGWNFTGVYGNFYRLKNTISFQINSLQPSRKMFVLVTHSQKVNQISPYCCLQAITNYRYQRQSLFSVATIVQPLTGYMDRLYSSIQSGPAIASLAKPFFSALRMQSVANARKKLIQSVSKIYLSALEVFKNNQNIPSSIMSILISALAMLKSIHSQPEIINNTPALDKVIAQRNFLQFTGASQLGSFFNPYLFDLSNLQQNMCQDSEDFLYPPTLQLKFANIRQGLFLLDNGLNIYLFIAKQCDPNLLIQVFGRQKFTKNDIISQQTIIQQNTQISTQVQNLIRVLRGQKSYGWVPLYIVRCGQNTQIQRSFYLNFFEQKYQQFKIHNYDLPTFLSNLTKPNFS